jgi:hypothetical protein
MDLRQALRDWQDLDVAGFHLARSLGIVDSNVDFQLRFKHIMWTDNPLGNCLVRVLREFVAIGILEEDDERVRWNPHFKAPA